MLMKSLFGLFPRRGLVNAVLVLCFQASAASWYVDQKAAGANTGANWSNAWTNFNAIAWSSLTPGDVVYVSGGKYGWLTTGNGGAPGVPIVIRTSREARHNGPVT